VLYAHTEITDKGYQPPPEYFLENRTSEQQPPTVTAYYYASGRADSYIFQMQWADPPQRVADGATITISQTNNRVQCPTTGCGTADVGVGLITWAEVSADGVNNWGQVAILDAPNHPSPTSAYASHSIQSASADPTFYLSFQRAQVPYIRIRIAAGDGGAGHAVLTTYYYAHVGVVRPPPQAPMLVSPAHGATVSATGLHLVWQQNGFPGYTEYFYLQIYAWNGTAWSQQPVWEGWAASPFPFTGHVGYFGWRVFAVDGNHYTDPTHESNPWYATSDFRWFYAQ
jgi:hypothetical protein